MNLMAKNKLVIGLTGCILSGKSLALSHFKKCGADTLSADELAHDALESAAGKKAVLSAFGTVNREALGGVVFKNAAARQKLEKILHPLVLKEASQRIKNSKKKIIIFEVPLLFEAGLEHSVDLTLLLRCSAKSLAGRLEGRNISCTEYNKRLKTQMPEDKKALLADLILNNDGNKTDLGNKVKRVYDALLKFTVDK